MEILIIGIIIVGLMVYVSTRIKKESKRAYERETFETEDFKITKPDEFLIPVNEDSPYVFEARSRDFGTDEARDFYQCRATVIVSEGVENEKVFEEEKTYKDVLLYFFHKSIANLDNNKTYKLEIALLPEHKDKYQEKINEMLNSFAIK